jgi:hypothetical protein
MRLLTIMLPDGVKSGPPTIRAALSAEPDGGEPEHPLRPEPERDLGVRVVPAEKEDAGVHRDEDVHQVGEAEAAVRREEDWQGEEEGCHLHPPRQPVLRLDPRDDQGDEVDPEEEER